MSTANSKPDTNSKAKRAPVIVIHEGPSGFGRTMFKLVPSILGSLIMHGVLVGGLGAYLLITHFSVAKEDAPPKEEANNLKADEPAEQQKDRTFNVVDVDPAATEFDTDIQYQADRLADFSVPGTVDPTQAIGIMDGDKSAAPVNLPAPGGFGGIGQGGALESFAGPGNSSAVGEVGGYGPRGMPLQGTFYGRSGATREYALRNGGGTDASEAAVAKGLKWLIRQQMSDGKWSLNNPLLADQDRGRESNDVAATAFGLLPLLAAGKTHKPAKDNPYDKNILKALEFLKRSQDKNGYFGGSMYSHGLATIAMCEAYGLTQDPGLRRFAQGGVNLLINTQHEGGGWRYGPARSPGDMSVTGWQIMALKSGMMSGLDVPSPTIKKAISFLDQCASQDEGYGYTGPGSSDVMTAVGLLCRQYLQNWGPAQPRMIKGVNNFLKKSAPAQKNVYYYYYATQVMHHFGGEAWRDWNEKMREYLIKTQDGNPSSANFGSWSPAGDRWASAGGRLMITSLNLLTLEVYYRYLPLYYRDAGYQQSDAVKKAQ